MVAEYEAVIRYLKFPPRALTLAIPRSRIFTASWNTPINVVLETMRSKAYSVAPVVENERLEAVFLDCTLIRAFLESKGFTQGPPATMNDLRSFIDHHGDQLGFVEYLHESATVRDAEERFAAAFANTTALRAVFLTSDGTPTGTLVGLITGYDLLGERKSP